MKAFRYLSLPVFFLLIILASCQKNDVIDNPGTPDQSAGLSETVLLQLVNEQRQAGCNCGSTYYARAPPVTWNDKLETAAMVHANDMNTNDFFDHTGRDGSSPGDRITRAGYIWRTYGENIAKGYPSEQAVINGWMGSVGHCANIMNPSFREMGAAKVNVYWVQVFGAR